MNARCPVKGPQQCKHALCGHCRTCKRPLDEHNGLSVHGAAPTCPGRTA